MTSKEKNRIEYLDLFRAFGIILMIMGHINFGNRFDYFIHAFHMPMFFVVSGFFFKHTRPEDYSFAEWIKKKIFSLLVPYIIFGVGHYVLYLLFNPFDISPLLHLLFINTNGLPICGALWFLTALFFTDIIYFGLDRYLKKELMLMAVVIISLIGNVLYSFFSITLPWALDASFVGIGLYHIGYNIKKNGIHNKNFITNLSFGINTLLAVVIVLSIFFNGYINMRENLYANIPLFWINAVGATIVGMNYSRMLYERMKGSWISKILQQIGKDSIVYVCLNQIVILIVARIIEKVSMLVYFNKVIILFLCLIILILISYIFTHSKLKIVIGRK